MINTRWLKILRDVQKRKAQTLLVSVSIFIGVFGVVTLLTMGEITVDALNSTIQQDRLAMIRAYVREKNEAATTATDYLAALNDLPDIERVEAIGHYPVYWKHPDAAKFTEGRIFGYSEPFDAIQIEPLDLFAGRWPKTGQQEIAVERRFASKNGFALGDPITLRILSSASDNGANNGANGEALTHEETWTIVGLVFEPYQYPTLPGATTQIPANTLVFATIADVNRISGLAGYNLIQARYTDFPTAQAHEAEFKGALAEQTPYVPAMTLIEDPAKNNLLEQTRTMSDVLALLSIVSLVVSGFLVLNIINATVIEQRRQIGIMKLLGATGADNFIMYAGIALIYGVIGVIPGILLGIPAGYAGAQQIAPIFNIFLDGFQTSPTAIITGILLGVLVPVLAAALPVLLGIRVSILQAITDLGIQSNYKPGPLAYLLDAFALPINLRQSLRNVIRKKGRLALTMITLALAAGAFMGIYAALSSVNAILDNSLGQLRLDMSISPNGTYDYTALHDLILQNVDGIDTIEPGTILAADIAGYEQQQVGPGPSFLIVSGINPANPDTMPFKIRSGRGWRDDPSLKGIIVSDPIADRLGLTVGDDITILIGGDPVTRPLIAIVAYSFESIWMRWDDLSEIGDLVSGAPVPNQYTTEINVNGSPIAALGINEQIVPFLTFTDGKFFTLDATTNRASGVIITQALADRDGYSVGDMLTLSADNTGNNLAVPITGIFEISPQLIQADQPAEGIGVYWQDLAALENLSLEKGAPIPSSLQVFLTKKNPSSDFVADKIQEINEVLLANGINANYTNWVENVAALAQLIQTAGVILSIAATLIAAVGAIGLLSTLSMSVFERQKEIGVMRSVGATSYTIAYQFLVEGLSVGLIAWVMGIPFSYWLDRTLVSQFNIENTPEAAYPIAALILGLVGTLVIATLASLWPSISAARRTVSDILRYQ
ncbi:MAG: ABC transporter permease [Anaerolineae bacterium]|nr:ABC transporter permease [Anaerolineae bacterium]